MTGNQARFQQAMNQGHSAAWDQQWDLAVTHYQHALEESPGHPNVLTSLGLALVEMQRYEEALACYRRAASVLPTDPMPQEKIAQICERVGRLNDAITASMQAADLYLKNRDSERAIECWKRVTRFDVGHLAAHSRLAVIYERLGRKSEAVDEYLAVASIVQRSGDTAKAVQAIKYALQIMPGNPTARNYLSLINSGQTLPQPTRAHGSTSSLRMAQVRHLEEESGVAPGKHVVLDPIADARQRALVALADILFEQTAEDDQKKAIRRQPTAIMRGADATSPEQSERAMILRHLGAAIDAQTQGQEATAVAELGKAVEAGLNHPAAYFNLGFLNIHLGHPEIGLRDLQVAVKHQDYALAGRLLLGQTLKKMGRKPEAASEYLEALRIADAKTVPADQADEVRQLYEPLIETQMQSQDERTIEAVCENVAAMLVRADWQQHIAKVRQQLPVPEEGNPPSLLAEMLLQTRSNQVVESLATIRKLSSQGLVKSAMEEAFSALQFAPTYLPLHVQIGDLLMKENRTSEGVEKFSVIAKTYAARGESNQACSILNRLVQIAPLDIDVRKRLVEQLVASGQVDEAVRATMELAAIYYRQADLDAARSTYMSALRMAQGSKKNRDLSVAILGKMADIDLQRLDLRQALRLYEQIRTLQPGDAKVRTSITDLNFRIGQDGAAYTEVDGFTTYLESHGQREQAVKFLKDVISEHPEKADLKQRLANLG